MLGASLLLTGLSVNAQAIWNSQHLDKVKTQLERPMYAKAYSALIAEADNLLSVEPLSVMQKKRPCPNGNNHNYTSLARYSHPDPNKPDGLPYITRDGVTNPEINLYDRNTLGTTANRVSTLALAYYLSCDEKYAAKASELLK
ncbi:MAG: alginate lyase family protein, partial [Muribaculaceae bacterium]|nr:alginate lyase family protein [Muribaculaceae bacterium]